MSERFQAAKPVRIQIDGKDKAPGAAGLARKRRSRPVGTSYSLPVGTTGPRNRVMALKPSSHASRGADVEVAVDVAGGRNRRRADLTRGRIVYNGSLRRADKTEKRRRCERKVPLFFFIKFPGGLLCPLT